MKSSNAPLLRLILCSIWFALLAAAAAAGQEKLGDQVRSEIPYRDGKVILVSDFQERVSETRYRAKGHVVVTFQDMVITADEVQYDQETRKGFAVGQTRFSQKQQWLSCSRAEFDLNANTAVFYDASGYTDRQMSVVGRTILKTGPDTYRIEDGMVTACPQKRPKWSFYTSRADVRVDKTARLHRTIFKIKGVPVFYFPYLIFPMDKKERSSGFIPFHTGTSTSKGRLIGEGYYQTLGPSADVLLYGNYFSLRGLALGAVFRARPNPVTHFTLEAYGINDKLNQGGVRLVVDGESLLKDDWRAVARVNITSNFEFRQAFEDSFRAATVSEEKATAFLTRDHESFSTNIAFQRQEVLFPVHSLVIRKLPSFEFLSLGTPLGNSPFVLSFRTSFDGVSRIDTSMQTPGLVQRLDFYPRLTVRLPPLKGFSLMPSVGVRETYYGVRLDDSSPTGVSNNSFQRRYADLSLDLKTPVLQRSFSSSWFGNFEHVIEPVLSYRWIHGVKDLQDTIRFDEEDAIADTSEMEYGIINRFYKERQTGSGVRERHEFMSFGLIQKYYFDPTFGGAFQQGQLNSFYPLDTVSGFYQTGIARDYSPLSAVLQISPQSGIHHDVRADFDPKLKRWRDGSISTSWQQGKFVLSGTYFRVLAVEPGIVSSNQIQAQVGYGKLDRGLSSSVTLSYNLLTSQLLNSQTRLNYIWDCCGISAEFTQFDLGLRTESRFSFSFTLKGIGSFGNLKRPESLF
jgi:LPS-assembly protein